MNPLLIMQIATVAFELIQKGTLTYATIRQTLKAGGATDEQLAALDVRYDAAIEARERDRPNTDVTGGGGD